MSKVREAKLDFLRNVGGCCLTYLRAGNDKTALEEALMTLLGYVREEIQRLGLTSDSLPSLPDSRPKPSKPEPKP